MSCNRPNNIWANLSQRINNNPNTNSICPTEYFYEDDIEFVDVFNKMNNNSNTNIQLGFIPEPKVGSIDANVFILSANPGINFKNPILCEKNNFIINNKIANLQNDNISNWLIDNPLGVTYWDNKLVKVTGGFGDALLKQHNISQAMKNSIIEKQIRNKLKDIVCTVEYSPYYSINFGHANLRLPSQNYIRDFILYVICHKKYIIITKCEKEWLGLVPELYDYKNLFTTVSQRNISLSNNNIIDKHGRKNNHIDYICKQLGIYGIIP